MGTNKYSGTDTSTDTTNEIPRCRKTKNTNSYGWAKNFPTGSEINATPRGLHLPIGVTDTRNPWRSTNIPYRCPVKNIPLQIAIRMRRDMLGTCNSNALNEKIQKNKEKIKPLKTKKIFDKCFRFVPSQNPFEFDDVPPETLEPLIFKPCPRFKLIDKDRVRLTKSDEKILYEVWCRFNKPSPVIFNAILYLRGFVDADYGPAVNSWKKGKSWCTFEIRLGPEGIEEYELYRANNDPLSFVLSPLYRLKSKNKTRYSGYDNFMTKYKQQVWL